jgi:adenosine deaminase
LVNTREAIQHATRAVLKDFFDDGVRYLELRTNPRETEGLSKREYVSIVLECISEFSQMETHLILSVNRRCTAAEAMEVVELAIEFGVVGVDLCGNPVRGEVKEFKEAFARAKSAGLKLTLHFGEVAVPAAPDELETLLSFQPDRLGHVVHVASEIQSEIIRQGIAVELCLTCNVKAKMISGDFVDHHFGFWRSQAISVSLGVSCYCQKHC